MVKKGEEDLIPEFKAPIAPVSPIFANVVGILAGEDSLIIDLGLSAPSYVRPYEVEDNQVSRICMTWHTSELLLALLKEVI